MDLSCFNPMRKHLRKWLHCRNWCKEWWPPKHTSMQLTLPHIEAGHWLRPARRSTLSSCVGCIVDYFHLINMLLKQVSCSYYSLRLFMCNSKYCCYYFKILLFQTGANPNETVSLTLHFVVISIQINAYATSYICLGRLMHTNVNHCWFIFVVWTDQKRINEKNNKP